MGDSFVWQEAFVTWSRGNMVNMFCNSIVGKVSCELVYSTTAVVSTLLTAKGLVLVALHWPLAGKRQEQSCSWVRTLLAVLQTN